MTTPTEFVLWLNGAAEVSDETPTPEQWAKMREKLGEAMGYLAKQKLLEKAEEQVLAERRAEERKQFEAAAMESLLQSHQNAYAAKLDEYKVKLDRFADLARRAETPRSSLPGMAGLFGGKLGGLK